MPDTGVNITALAAEQARRVHRRESISPTPPGGFAGLAVKGELTSPMETAGVPSTAPACTRFNVPAQLRTDSLIDLLEGS